MDLEILRTKLLEASKEIHEKSLKGGANILYNSSKVFKLFYRKNHRIDKIKKILKNV